MRNLIYILAFIISLPSYADSSTKLHQIQHQIQQIRSVLTHAHNQQAELQRQLKVTEMHISDLTVQLQQTQQALAPQELLLKNLTEKQLQYQNQLTTQQQTLGMQLRAMYMLGQQQYLKVLLNQEDPNQFSRIFTYYRYINDRRLELIKRFNSTLVALAQNKQQIQQQTQKLQLIEAQLERNKKQLMQNQNQREQLLTTLNNEIQSKQQQLQTLTANKEALEKVIKRLSYASFFKRTFSPSTFMHHGKFPWPTQGKIIEGFGTTIQRSQLKTTGVLIAAREGQNVYAISPGKVVFANWMAGYGLLLIIDHDNGFMTIYGRNQTLYRKVGDTVNRGDLVATVGSTGGYKTAALYFGIRQNGRPLDPMQWCG